MEFLRVMSFKLVLLLDLSISSNSLTTFSLILPMLSLLSPVSSNDSIN